MGGPLAETPPGPFVRPILRRGAPVVALVCSEKPRRRARRSTGGVRQKLAFVTRGHELHPVRIDLVARQRRQQSKMVPRSNIGRRRDPCDTIFRLQVRNRREHVVEKLPNLGPLEVAEPLGAPPLALLKKTAALDVLPPASRIVSWQQDRVEQTRVQIHTIPPR